MSNIKVGDLIRLNPEYHGGLDDLAVVVKVFDDRLPNELVVRVQGYDVEMDMIYEDEVEVVSEVLYKQS